MLTRTPAVLQGVSPEDEALRDLSAKIVQNICHHPRNRTKLYKIELHLRSSAFAGDIAAEMSKHAAHDGGCKRRPQLDAPDSAFEPDSDDRAWGKSFIPPRLDQSSVEHWRAGARPTETDLDEDAEEPLPEATRAHADGAGVAEPVALQIEAVRDHVSAPDALASGGTVQPSVSLHAGAAVAAVGDGPAHRVPVRRSRVGFAQRRRREEFNEWVSCVVHDGEQGAASVLSSHGTSTAGSRSRPRTSGGVSVRQSVFSASGYETRARSTTELLRDDCAAAAARRHERSPLCAPSLEHPPGSRGCLLMRPWPRSVND